MEDTMVRERFLSGDDEVYAWLYRKYVNELFSYGMRLAHDSELVKDCIHDVFVKLYGRRSALAEVSRVRLYLLISLRNEIYTALKKSNKSGAVEWDNSTEPLFSVDYTAEESLIEREQTDERQRRIRRALNALSARQKEVFYYRYTLEMKLPEICEVMGINYQSLQNLMQRSFRKVRETIDGETTEKETSLSGRKRNTGEGGG